MKRFCVVIALAAIAVASFAAVPKSCEISAVKFFGIQPPAKEAMDIPTSLSTSFDHDSLLDWYIFNADGGSTYWSIFNASSYAHTGSLFAACYYDTLYSSTLRNDDWLITSRVEITDATYELRYWIRSIDTSGSWLDDYEVRISASGDTVLASFTDLVDSVEDASSAWHELVIDLSGYASDTIRVAFRYVSQDDWMLMLDDVSIEPRTGVVENHPLAEDFYLVGNEPNPFNPTTTIRANGSASGTVDIFDMSGRRIDSVELSGGSGVWDGHSSNGEAAPCGIYLYKLRGSDNVKRMVLLK